VGLDINGNLRLANGLLAAVAAGIDIDAHPVIFDHIIAADGSLLSAEKGRFLRTWKGWPAASIGSRRGRKVRA
jgi:hypothetical protein